MVAAQTITFALTEGKGATTASDLITVTAAALGFGIFTSVDVTFTSDSNSESGLGIPSGAMELIEQATNLIDLANSFPTMIKQGTIEVLNDLDAGQIPEPATLSMLAIPLLALSGCARKVWSRLGRSIR